MPESTSTIVSEDGVDLFTRTWAPDDAADRAMLLVHGLAEHSGRWDHVARFFVERGYAVVGFDLRGHGHSGGTKGHVDHFSDFLDDIQSIVNSDLVRTDLPWVMYGHSLGGLITTCYLADQRPHPSAAVLSAPAIAADIPVATRLAAQVLSPILPRLALPNPVDLDHLSRDASVGEAYDNDPLVYQKGTTRFAQESFAAQDRIVGRLEDIGTPTLVIHGAEDTLVPPSASAPLATLECVDRKVYPGLRHELHNEPEQVQVLSDVAAWLDATLA